MRETRVPATMTVLQHFGDGIYRETTHGLDLLRRRLDDGRIINIDSVGGAMFAGGRGIAHMDMDNGNNRVRRTTTTTRRLTRRAETLTPAPLDCTSRCSRRRGTSGG